MTRLSPRHYIPELVWLLLLVMLLCLIPEDVRSDPDWRLMRDTAGRCDNEEADCGF